MATTSRVLPPAPGMDDSARAVEEERLARAAAGGDGTAFATLYDRYEQRIFNFCLRLLNSSDDAADATQEAFLKVLQRLPHLEGRELNFSAYLYTAARNASYDVIGRRKKAEPVEEIPEGPGVAAREPGFLDEDPERSALLESLQDEVRAANARLPERQREVLALRELDELSYDEIAGIMDMNRNSVAQLISRARIKLRDELRGTALASIATSSPECERALPLISMRQDGQLRDRDDRAWLDAHLGACDTCRVSVEAIEEAGVSYRAWLPIVPLEWLRQATIARASELVGADWSDVADGGEGAEAEWDDDRTEGFDAPGANGGPSLGAVAGAGAGAGAGNGHALPLTAVAGAHGAAGQAGAPPGDEGGHKRRRLAVLLGLALVLLLAGTVAIVTAGDDPPADSAGATEEIEKPGPGGQPQAGAPQSGGGGAGGGAASGDPGAAQLERPGELGKGRGPGAERIVERVERGGITRGGTQGGGGPALTPGGGKPEIVRVPEIRPDPTDTTGGGDVIIDPTPPSRDPTPPTVDPTPPSRDPTPPTTGPTPPTSGDPGGGTTPTRPTEPDPPRRPTDPPRRPTDPPRGPSSTAPPGTGGPVSPTCPTAPRC